MAILWTVLLIISVFFFWLLGILGLPGNWLMLIATAIYALAVPTDATASLWRQSTNLCAPHIVRRMARDTI